MVKKRLIGVVTIRNGHAVQSFSYNSYLPLGDPLCLIQNLNRWGVDEIFIQVIDRSINKLGPDFDLLNKIGEIRISTPLIYCGGIRNVNDAINVIKHGSDRIVLDHLLRNSNSELISISKALGSQALIASLPIVKDGNKLLLYNYESKIIQELEEDILEIISNKDIISEVLLINKETEGLPNSFDIDLISLFPDNDTPLIAFGGISEVKQIQDLFSKKQVSAVGIGNFLNYREHSVQLLKESIKSDYLRSPIYSSTI